jgi:hypothetical protein
MKKKNRFIDRDIRPEYDFASMKGGVRGKYVKALHAGTNLVLLEPDITTAFPTDDAVNEALRGLLKTANAVRKRGGLSNRTLQPALRERQNLNRRRNSQIK